MKLLISKNAAALLERSPSDVQRSVATVYMAMLTDSWNELVSSGYIKKVVAAGRELWVARHSDVRVFLARTKADNEVAILIVDFAQKQ